MDNQEFQRQKDLEDDLRRLETFRPIDDTFMRVLFRNNLPLAEVVLRIITGKDDLHLISEETQRDLKRLVGARGICLDVYGVDDKNEEYDLEIQRSESGAKPKRARYHAGAMDIEYLDPGQDFEALRTSYVIMLCEHDPYRAGKALYPIERINLATGEPFDDHQHILYVNASYKGDDDLGKLLHDFLCSDPDEMYTPLLAERTRFFKRNPEGRRIMCEVMEQLRDESIERGIQQGLQMGIDQNRIDSIKSLMKKLGYTLQQAMDVLDIPAAEQGKYLAKL